METLEGLNQTI